LWLVLFGSGGAGVVTRAVPVIERAPPTAINGSVPPPLYFFLLVGFEFKKPSPNLIIRGDDNNASSAALDYFFFYFLLSQPEFLVLFPSFLCQSRRHLPLILWAVVLRRLLVVHADVLMVLAVLYATATALLRRD
jgi:hypothetical protein